MIRVIRALAMALGAFASSLAIGGDESVLEAAKRFRSDASWQENSIVKADINCDGKSEYIVLGHTKYETIVAAFGGKSSRKPDSIAFSADRINPESAAIILESLDIGDEDFKEMLGGVPEGYQRSKSCKGIGLSDGNRDTVHIYWSRKRREFEAWSL